MDPVGAGVVLVGGAGVGGGYLSALLVSVGVGIRIVILLAGGTIGGRRSGGVGLE